ncbi:hypothetical protein NJ7G_1677 [Natrinema sp. J7-2]|nr:hypothetical protein NJ7G_1677 [Natrinema sp. J7-2]
MFPAELETDAAGGTGDRRRGGHTPARGPADQPFGLRYRE